MSETVKPDLPRVAVLLAAYNGMPWIPDQVESILGQANVAVELFVSVDRSADSTQSWFEDKAAADSRVRLLSVGQSGSASQNFFRLLRDVDTDGFDAVCLADQDDIWLEDKIATGVQSLRQNRAQGYSSDVISLWQDGRQKMIVKSSPQRLADYLFEGPGPGCTFVLAPELVQALKTFLIENRQVMKSVYYHDWFIYAYARANGHQWVIDNRACIHYRQHDSNVVGANVGLLHKCKRARAVIAGHWFYQVLLIARLLSGGDREAADVQALLNKGRLGFLGLALKVGRYRRVLRDRCLLALSCMLMAVIGFQQPDD